MKSFLKSCWRSCIALSCKVSGDTHVPGTVSASAMMDSEADLLKTGLQIPKHNYISLVINF